MKKLLWGIFGVVGLVTFYEVESLIASDPMGNIPVLDRRFSDFSPAGFRLGMFHMQPSLDTSISYTSNALQASNNEQSDKILTAVAGVTGTADLGRSNISINGNIEQIKYQEISDLNRTNFHGEVNLDYDLSSTSSLQFQLAKDRTHETRFENPVEQDIFEPIQVDEHGFLTALILRPAHTQWAFTAGYNDINYRNTKLVSTNAVSVQDDRDHAVYSGGVKVSYGRFGDKYKQRLVPFLGLNIAKSSYERNGFETGTSDYTGTKKDSTNYNVIAGIDIKPTGKLRGVASIGYGYDRPDDSTLEAQDDMIVNIDLSYLYSPLTNFTFNINRFFAGNNGASSMALETQLSGKIVHELTRQWILNAGLDYIQTEFSNDLTDTTLSGNIGFDYRMNKTFAIGGDIRYIGRESDRANGDYDETRAMIRLKTNF